MGTEMLFVELIPPTSESLVTQPGQPGSTSSPHTLTEQKGIRCHRPTQNKARETKGRLKDAAGKATNDRSLQAEGKGDMAAGNVKQAGER